MFPRIAAILAFLLVGSTVRAEDPPPVVAVFEIENRGSPLSGDELVALTDYLGTKLGEQGNYQIIPRQEIRKRLVEQKKASYKACYDQSCQIEVGREMAAQFTVSASISKVGNTCIITSAMYDLRKAATHKTGTAKGPCTADDLLTAVEQIAQKLEGSGAETAAAPPEPAVETPPAPKKPPDVIRAPPRKLRKRTKSVLAAALWSALPGGGMYYVGKWGWGIFYTSVIIGGYGMFFATIDATDNDWTLPVGGLMIGVGWLVSIIHAMVAASNWRDPDEEVVGLDRGFHPIPAIVPGRDPHPAVHIQILSGRF
jgi:hypothetical protein